MFKFFLKDHYGVYCLIQCQQLFKLVSMALLAYVSTVFQQQVFGSFKNSLILFRGFAIFAVSDFIDDAAKIGHNMKQIEHYFGIGQFVIYRLVKTTGSGLHS